MQQRAEVTPKPERLKTAAEFLKSGMTMVAWSKERQINRFTLHNWVNEYRHEEYQHEPKPALQSCEWLEVNVNAAADAIASSEETAMEQASALCTPIRISIGDTQIEVTTSFDEKALASVIKVVKCQC